MGETRESREAKVNDETKLRDRNHLQTEEIANGKEKENCCFNTLFFFSSQTEGNI